MKKILVCLSLFILLTSCGLEQGVQRGYIISQTPLEEIVLEDAETNQDDLSNNSLH